MQMDSDTAGKLTLLVNGVTQVCKFGFNLSGKFVLAIVLVLGVGGSAALWAWTGPHTPAGLLDALVSGYLISAAAIGTYELLARPSKKESEEAENAEMEALRAEITAVRTASPPPPDPFIPRG